MMLWSFDQVRATILHPDMHTGMIFNTQHVATPRNRVAKRARHVAPNNVTICGAEMLRSFGRGFKGTLCASQSFGTPRTYIARAF